MFISRSTNFYVLVGIFFQDPSKWMRILNPWKEKKISLKKRNLEEKEAFVCEQDNWNITFLSPSSSLSILPFYSSFFMFEVATYIPTFLLLPSLSSSSLPSLYSSVFLPFSIFPFFSCPSLSSSILASFFTHPRSELLYP